MTVPTCVQTDPAEAVPGGSEEGLPGACQVPIHRGPIFLRALEGG